MGTEIPQVGTWRAHARRVNQCKYNRDKWLCRYDVFGTNLPNVRARTTGTKTNVAGPDRKVRGSVEVEWLALGLAPVGPRFTWMGI